MDEKTLKTIEEAFLNGAYSIAYDLSNNAIKTGNIGNIVYLYHTLSEIGMGDISTMSFATVQSNISFAFSQVVKECTTVQNAEDIFSKSLTLCGLVADTLEVNFNSLDEKLRRQYQGSSGVSISSDDPAEKEKMPEKLLSIII